MITKGTHPAHILTFSRARTRAHFYAFTLASTGSAPRRGQPTTDYAIFLAFLVRSYGIYKEIRTSGRGRLRPRRRKPSANSTTPGTAAALRPHRSITYPET